MWGDVVVTIIEPADLEPFVDIDSAKAEAMIDDALAMAQRVAPCITDDDFEYADAAKAILRAAILRWEASGSGAYSTHQTMVGNVQQMETFDSRQQRRGMFSPSEINDLAALCADTGSGKAYEVDTMPKHSGFYNRVDWWTPTDRIG